jgi:hypothetical protein
MYNSGYAAHPAIVHLRSGETFTRGSTASTTAVRPSGGTGTTIPAARSGTGRS